MSANAEMAAAWDGPEGDHWADHADRYEATSMRYRRALLDALDLGERSAVLDVGCGTGAATIEAGRVASAWCGPRSRPLVADARAGTAAAAAEGLDHVRFEQADAQVHPFDAATYDVAISCFGAMFFEDPVAAFANIRRSLRPGASFVTLAWRDLQRNEWVDSVRTALAAGRDLPTPPPGAQGPSAWPTATSRRSGSRRPATGDIDFSSIDEPICFGTDADDAYSFVSTFGITRGLTADLDDATRTAAARAAAPDARGPRDGRRRAVPGSAWLITAANHGRLADGDTSRRGRRWHLPAHDLSGRDGLRGEPVPAHRRGTAAVPHRACEACSPLSRTLSGR